MKWGWVLPLAERVVKALRDRRDRKQGGRDAMTTATEPPKDWPWTYRCKACGAWMTAPTVDGPWLCSHPRCMDERTPQRTGDGVV